MLNIPRSNSCFLLGSWDKTLVLWVDGSTYLSQDSGLTWASLSVGEKEQIRAVTFHSGQLYLFSAPDGGNAWQVSTSAPPYKKWAKLDVVPQQSSNTKILFDRAGNLFFISDHSIQTRANDGAWVNLATGVLTGKVINAAFIDSGDVLYLGTSGGLYWSNDRGKAWHSSVGEAPHVVTVKQLVPYRESAFFALLDQRPLLLCLTSVSPASLGNLADDYLLLDVHSDADPTTVLLDGLQVPGLNVDRIGDQVRLRLSKSAMQSIKDGMHELSVETSNSLQKVSHAVYIYKEIARASTFRPYGSSYAIVVAASGSWDSAEFLKLDRAVPQAKEVADVLKAQGFNVETFFEERATRQKIEAYLQELAAKLTNNDRVLFYFSGHGDTEAGALGEVGYLLTYPATKRTLFTEAIPMSLLQAQYVNLKAKHMLFVLDACFAGLAIQKTESLDETTLRKFLRYEEIAAYTKDPARAILAAGTKGQPALDVNGGIFTKAFLAGIKGGADYSHNGVITIDQLSAYIQSQVSEEAHRHGYNQTPQLGLMPVYGDGKFVFIK